jgi:signal transduction histidine kinase
VSVNAEPHDGNLVIKITDTGVGISAEEQGQLFTKFHRGTSTMEYEYKGAGIGLYATKLIIDAHKGSIAVQSTPERGSVFSIEIPLVV